MMALAMAPQPLDLKTWLAHRLRGTNWAAAGISAAIQGAVLAMLITMGIVSVTPDPPKREKLTVTTIATSPQQQPAQPTPPKPQQQDKPVVQPRADTVMPPTKIQVSSATPVAAAAERAPDPPAPAAAAPSAAAAPAAAAAAPGPVRVANLNADVNCPDVAYPAKSRSEKQEGTVAVNITLSSAGRTTEASIRRSSGFRLLDEAALQRARGCRGRPRMENGRAVDTPGYVAFAFTLRKS